MATSTRSKCRVPTSNGSADSVLLNLVPAPPCTVSFGEGSDKELENVSQGICVLKQLHKSRTTRPNLTKHGGVVDSSGKDVLSPSSLRTAMTRLLSKEKSWAQCKRKEELVSIEGISISEVRRSISSTGEEEERGVGVTRT